MSILSATDVMIAGIPFKEYRLLDNEDQAYEVIEKGGTLVPSDSIPLYEGERGSIIYRPTDGTEVTVVDVNNEEDIPVLGIDGKHLLCFPRSYPRDRFISSPQVQKDVGLKVVHHFSNHLCPLVLVEPWRKKHNTIFKQKKYGETTRCRYGRPRIHIVAHSVHTMHRFLQLPTRLLHGSVSWSNVVWIFERMSERMTALGLRSRLRDYNTNHSWKAVCEEAAPYIEGAIEHNPLLRKWGTFMKADCIVLGITIPTFPKGGNKHVRQSTGKDS